MALLVLTIAAACLCHGAASYETEEFTGHSEHEAHNQKFNPMLEIIRGPHEEIQVKGYEPKLEFLGQHVEIPEPPIKVIRVTKTVAIKVPVPYPVKITEKVPYPVHVSKPYPVPVPQIIKVPHVLPAHHHNTHEPSILSLYKKAEEAAPVWPSKEEQSEFSEGSDYGGGDGYAADKVSHEHGDGGGSDGRQAAQDEEQHGGGFSNSYGQQDAGQHGGGGFSGSYGQQSAQDDGQHGGYSFGGAQPAQHLSLDSSGGTSYGPPQGHGFGASHGGYQAAAAPNYGSNEVHHYQGDAGGGDSHSAPQPAQASYDQESKSYDTAIQEYLHKINQQTAPHGAADSYGGSYGAGAGGSLGADDYRHVHQLESAKIDRVSYGQ